MNFPRIAALVASPGRRILVALFLVLGWVMPAQAALGFAPALNYGVQLDPAAVADGDFNGDGKVDLVVANKGSDSFSILLGNGNGTFETPLNYVIGSSGRDPVSIATGDFNGDSRLDLAVACSSSDNVIIFLNNGNNIFSGVVRDVGVMPVSVAAGDLNGDGNLDLAVANLFSDNISILLGYGNGTFTTAVNYGTGDGPDGVAVADLNGDGRLDLAVANVLGDNVSILLGSSNGTFGGGSSQAAGDMPYGVAVADLNGDGKTDLAVANELSDNVSILLNNGSTWGILAAAVNYGAGDGPTSVMAADFNGDGKVDLAVANDLSNNVSILLGNGNGNGTFAAPVSYDAGGGPRSVAQADFNGDGKPDLAVANSNSNSVSILLNMSNISYTVNATSGAGGTITPPTQTVNYGSTAAFTLTPDTGYHIDAISGCGGTLAGNIYTTAPITADCTVSASFTLNSYTVRAFANDGGIIAPSPQTISYGYTVELYVYPNTGYSLEAVTGTCGGSLVGNTYTTAPITADCTVIANFMPSYTVSTTSGVGGTISPPSQIVSFLSTASFAVTPDTGYSIGAVSGCGGTLSGNTYTTDAITGACTVAASFTLNSYTVSASAGEGGTLTPATQTINHGSTATFTATPATNYTTVMGGSCGGSLAVTSYTTAAIVGDCSVTAQFIPNFTASDESGAALGDTTVPSGGALSFRLTDGSSNFDVIDDSNANGVRGTLVDNGDGSYRFVPPTSGAFAGDYLLTITDTVSGYSKQLTITVPLQVTLSRSMLLAEGERNHAAVTVSGAAPATAITLTVESSALSAVPTTDDSGMVATDDGPNGNPASGQVTAQPTAQSIAFTVVASAAGYTDGRAAAQVVPAISYAGSLQSPVGSVVPGKAELRTTVGGITTTLLDELNLPYETSADAQGQFTLIGPADGLDYLLRFTAAGYTAKSVAASDCLAFNPCLVVLDYEFTSATPELNPPGGEYIDRVEITLTTTTADATLVYTLDGTTPSRSNGISVASGSVVELINSKTLKVMAWKEGLNDSAVVSVKYTLEDGNEVGVAELLDMVNVNSTQESSGGGAMGWGALLALGALVVGRRRALRSRLGGTL